ncbi:PDZ domain-containing protein 7-like isoform X2 [Anneissia japonica]|uniref:PDZ domain-containing protein 7-like isoform X2 n=1 Tax=Anneissia japonica TaxID=1529436 RepID=UPI0014257DC3|nr:PDZ domain-containing protein 7-like isoform X2 [Anneissia japonica]
MARIYTNVRTSLFVTPRRYSTGSVHVGQHSPSSLCHVTIQKVQGSLGFSIRGGSEHGLGIFVSSVDHRSPADVNGLEVGDQLIEVNNVNFENIATSSAVMVLQGSNRLRMKVKRTGKVPGFKYAREKTSWYDTVERTITDQNEDGQPTPPRFNMSGTRMLQDAGERRVIIKLAPGQCIGFNLRGGSEYDLGIYVSKLDPDGAAKNSGIQVGDQIVNVNGESFLNISHVRAIDFLRNQRHLIMTIRTVNRYPAYKEMVAEYSWVNEQPIKKNKRPQSRSSPKMPPLIPAYANGSSMQVPMDHTERFTQTPPLDEGGVAQRIPSNDGINTGMNRLSSQNSHLGVKQQQQPQYKRVASTGDLKHFERLSEGVAASAVINMPRRQSQPPPYSATSQNYPAALQTTSTTQIQAIPPPAVTHQEISAAADHADSGSSKSVQPSRNQPVMGTHALKSEKRSLGRSHSMKHPGEKSLPPMQEKEMKERQKVKRNRTFREILFGMKMKRKEKEKDKSKTGSMSGKVKRRIPLGSFRKTKTSRSLDELDKVSRADTDPSWANKTWAVRRNSIGDLRSVEAGSSHGTSSDGRQSVASLQATTRSNSPEPEFDFEPAITCMMELAQRLLTQDECTAIVRHIRRYHEDHDVEQLVHPLLAILDKPEKVILLREIRSTLYQTDLGRFESMVARREAAAFEELQSGTSNYIRKSPMLRRSTKTAPPKKTILETKPNTLGGFHLQTTQNMNREKRRKEELERLKKERHEEIQRKMKEQKEADDYAERAMPYGHIIGKSNNRPIGGNTSDFKLTLPTEDIYHNSNKNTLSERNSEQSTTTMNADRSTSPKHARGKHKRIEVSDYFQRSDEDSEISPIPDRKSVKNLQNGRSSGKTSERQNQKRMIVSDYLQRSDSGEEEEDDDNEVSPIVRKKSIQNPYQDHTSTGPSQKLGQKDGTKQEKPKEGVVQLSNGLSNNFEDLDSSLGSGKFTANPIFGMDNIPKKAPNESEENTRPRSAVRFELNANFYSPEVSPRDSDSSPRYITTPDIIVNDELDFVIEDNESVESDGSLDHIPTTIDDDDEESELRFSDESDTSAQMMSRKGKYKFVTDDADAFSTSSSSTLKGGMPEKRSSNLHARSRNKTPSPVRFHKQDNKPSPYYPLGDFNQKNKDFNDRQQLSVDGMEEYFSERESKLSFNGSPNAPKKGILKNKSEKPVLSNGYNSEEEPFPLKAIIHSARMEANTSHSDNSEMDEGIVQRVIKKTRTSLGISISGGSDSRQQPQVLIDKVFPGGAAHDDGFIQPGFQLVKVDGQSLQSLSHNQVVEVIRKAYSNAARDRMTVTVLTS